MANWTVKGVKCESTHLCHLALLVFKPYWTPKRSSIRWAYHLNCVSTHRGCSKCHENVGSYLFLDLATPMQSSKVTKVSLKAKKCSFSACLLFPLYGQAVPSQEEQPKLLVLLSSLLPHVCLQSSFSHPLSIELLSLLY